MYLGQYYNWFLLLNLLSSSLKLEVNIKIRSVGTNKARKWILIQKNYILNKIKNTKKRKHQIWICEICSITLLRIIILFLSNWNNNNNNSTNFLYVFYVTTYIFIFIQKKIVKTIYGGTCCD